MGWGKEDRVGVVGVGLRQVVLFLAMGAGSALAAFLYVTLFG
jgi:hypothetical protein